MDPEEGGSELNVRDYLLVLRRRRWFVIAAVLLVGGTAFLVSHQQTPVYSAQAKVLLKSSDSVFATNTGARPDPDRVARTEIEVLKSEPVRAAVRQKLGFDTKVDPAAVGQTDVIGIRAESTRPRTAADIANAYATVYIDMRHEQQVNDLLAAGGPLQSKISDLQKQIEDLERQVAQAPDNARAQLSDVLGRQRDTLLQQQALFKQRLDQLQVDAASKTGGAELVAQAPVPTSPVRPTPTRNGILGMVVGLLLGVGLAFLREHLDDSIKDKSDFERAVPGVGVLGIIPAIADWKVKEESRVLSLTDPRSSAAEAYRGVRTAIQFLGVDRPLHTIQVTSANAQEGKTTTLANLGVAFASAGLRVVLVCCDLRRPRIHEFFGLKNDVGFTSVLLGSTPLAAALQVVPRQDRLLLLASGPLPPNPSELLSSERAGQVIRNLAEQSDIVLIDCPPLLPVTDALVLAHRVDGTILTIAGTTTRKEAARAHELLRQVNAPLLGAVLNGVPEDTASASSYYYYYGGRASHGGAVPAPVSGNGAGDGAAAGDQAGASHRHQGRRTRARRSRRP
jgi:capsular exopolysaccharide synthesis family protein